jgi:hypothetical protein
LHVDGLDRHAEKKNKREQPEEIDEGSSRKRLRKEDNKTKSHRKLPPVGLGLVKDELMDGSPSFARLLPLQQCEIANDDG